MLQAKSIAHHTVAEDGKSREMLTIPLRRLWSWLSGITASKVKPEIRPILERYQAECDEVLEAHWTRHREGLPAPLEKGQEPSGLLFEQVYGRTKAERDAEAERLAVRVVIAFGGLLCTGGYVHSHIYIYI